MVIALLPAAGCGGSNGASEATTTTTSSTTAATTTTDPTTATSPPDPTSPCDVAGAGLELDLDGVAPLERVVLGSNAAGGSEITICDGATVVASAIFEGSVNATLGVVDIDDVAPFEILVGSEAARGPAVQLVRWTLRGLQVTDVIAERWMDPPDDPEAPFEGAGFECADTDDDGRKELLIVSYRPADAPGSGDEPLVNIRVGSLTDDGGVPVVAALDQFEMAIAEARARFADEPRCRPGAPERVSFSVGANGWAILESGDTFAGRGDSVMHSIAYDAVLHRFAAVGGETPSPLIGEFFDPSPAVWWSDNRITWNRADLGDAAGMLWDAAALPGGGFVAVGTGSDGAAAWRSLDGISWHRASVAQGSDDAPGLGGATMTAVAATPTMLVAVGMETYSPTVPAPGDDLDPAVWVSADGEEWERVHDASFGTAGFQANENGEFNGEIVDVAFIPGIGFIAAGSASRSDPTIDYPPQMPAVWRSQDARTWERQDLNIDARLYGVVAMPNGAAIVGVEDVNSGPSSDAVVFTSADGVEWREDDGEFGGLSGQDGIQSITAGLDIPDVGVVLVGSDEAEFEYRGGAAAWVADVEHGSWHRMVHDPRVFGDIDAAPSLAMRDAAWDGSALIVVGVSGRAVDMPGGVGSGCCVLEPAVWMWDPTG